MFCAVVVIFIALVVIIFIGLIVEHRLSKIVNKLYDIRCSLKQIESTLQDIKMN